MFSLVNEALMDSEDDIQPLINYETESRELFLELTVQILITDPEYHKVQF